MTQGFTMQGWINIKIRSTLNVRPRHKRYVILEGGRLHTFRFQPPISVQCSTDLRPLRTYLIHQMEVLQHSRKFGFVVQAKLMQENCDKTVEIDVESEQLRDLWGVKLMEAVSLNNAPTKGLPADTKSEPEASPEETVLKPTEANNQLEPCEPQSIVEMTQPGILKVGASVHRGIENNKGENNCFLNVIIQTFWHLRTMKRSILKFHSVNSGNGPHVMNILQDIMIAYEETATGKLHPGSLRKGLRELCEAEHAFAEGSMGDVEETLLTLLNLMHRQTSSTSRSSQSGLTDRESSDSDNYSIVDLSSVPQSVLAHQIYDRQSCRSCHKKTKWNLFSNYVIGVISTELTSKLSSIQDVLLHLVDREQGNKPCITPGCSGKFVIEREIRRMPSVFIISVMWHTDNASKADVQNALSKFQMQLDLSRAFKVSRSSSMGTLGPGARKLYDLRGFVCYYGQHYFAFFYSTVHQKWLLFDDSKVTIVGPWSTVVDKCVKGRYQPVLLFYEVPGKQKDSSVHIDYRANVIQTDKPNSVAEEANEGVIDQDANALSSRGKSLLLTGLSPSAKSPQVRMSNTATRSSGRVPAELRRPLEDHEYVVKFTAEDAILGIYLEYQNSAVRVMNFPRGPKGEIFAGEKCAEIAVCDIAVSVNGCALDKNDTQKVVQAIQSQPRPLYLRFRRSVEFQQLRAMGFEPDIAKEGLLRCNGNVQAAANFCFEKSSA